MEKVCLIWTRNEKPLTFLHLDSLRWRDRMALAEEVVGEYRKALVDLNVNSKPLISMLTMLADDHEQHAPEIVKVIEAHINKVYFHFEWIEIIKYLLFYDISSPWSRGIFVTWLKRFVEGIRMILENMLLIN